MELVWVKEAIHQVHLNLRCLQIQDWEENGLVLQ